MRLPVLTVYYIKLLVLTFTEAKATAPRYYNDDLLLESLNSKLQSFYYKLSLYMMSQQNLVFPNDAHHLKHGIYRVTSTRSLKTWTNPRL